MTMRRASRSDFVSMLESWLVIMAGAAGVVIAVWWLTGDQ